MKKVLSQFNKTLSVDELVKTVNAELKAVNLSSAACDIQFKNYPTNAAEDEGITNDILNSGLNTIVFDTDNNKVVIYITADAGLFITKEEHEELNNKVENGLTLLTDTINDVNEIETKIGTLVEVNEANKLKYENLNTQLTGIEERVGNIEGKNQTLEQRFALTNTGINECKNKNTEIEGKLTELESKINQLEAEIEKLKTPAQEGDV